MNHAWKLHAIARGDPPVVVASVWFCEGCLTTERNSEGMPPESGCPGKWPRTEEDLALCEAVLEGLRASGDTGSFVEMVVGDLERAVRQRREA